MRQPFFVLAFVRQQKATLILFGTTREKVPVFAGMTEKECYVGRILEERYC